jgi:hypothetical protein
MSGDNRMTRLLAGWFGLVIYVFASSPIGAGSVALFGTLDVDHQALMKMSSAGPCLVLHHQQKCTDHEHHAVANALTFFSRPAGDHIVQFSGVDGFWRDTQEIDSSACSEVHIDLFRLESITAFANQLVHDFPPPGPPPDIAGNLFCPRSTVLRI